MNINQTTTPTNNMTASSSSTPRRTKAEFPIKVYAMLELADNIFEFAQAVTWLPHGRAFRIHNKVKFMEEVVPMFFNQTKIRSFNRQLHLWGFRRIGRGDEQVWHHENFLRGKPEDMKHMVRTKIKGNTAISSEDVSVPNFDDLPPLPVCNKRPTAILDVIEDAIMKLPSASGAITHCGSTMPTVSPPQPGIFNGDCQMFLPNTETPCHFNLDCNQDESSFQIPNPPLFQRRVSTESEFVMHPCIPIMHCHLPLQAGNIESTEPMHETSMEGSSHQAQSHIMLQADFNDLCFSPLKQNNDDFEPLSFMDDDTPCDDFASFIEGAIHQIEG